MTGLEWVDVDPADMVVPPEPDTRCEACKTITPGAEGDPRTWTLSINGGSISVVCSDCGESPYDCIDELELSPVRARLKFVPECPNLGGWHGLDRCECSWWFVIEVPGAEEVSA